MTGEQNEFNRKLAIGVISLVAVLFAGGIAVTYKGRDRNRNTKAVASGLQPLTALPPGAGIDMVPPHGNRGPCFMCHPVANTIAEPGPQWGRSVASMLPPANPSGTTGFSYPQNATFQTPVPQPVDVAPAALTAPMNAPKGAGLLTPVEQNAANKILVEGHWLGMELMDLTPALRKVYYLAPDVQGVIVDEITLESAESGILAGDVITSVAGKPTRDLTEFLRATEAVAGLKTAPVVVNRMGSEQQFSLTAKNTQTLGFAQVEGAQPIKPGALSPHRGRTRACTECHVIMAAGGQLPVDEGDITPSPPPIAQNARAPHQYRGPCNSCHVAKPQ